MNINEHGFGIGDASYKAAGELDGLRLLVDDFYTFMETLPQAGTVLRMHKGSMEVARKKLCYFLCGWLGGPRLYSEYYGSINIPGAHRHLKVSEDERDAWLLCMKKAIERQNYSSEFKVYLLAQLKVPANRIVEAGGG